jgi:hypothetical protein
MKSIILAVLSLAIPRTDNPDHDPDRHIAHHRDNHHPGAIDTAVGG